MKIRQVVYKERRSSARSKCYYGMIEEFLGLWEYGRICIAAIAADCKSVTEKQRWFESNFSHCQVSTQCPSPYSLGGRFNSVSR